LFAGGRCAQRDLIKKKEQGKAGLSWQRKRLGGALSPTRRVWHRLIAMVRRQSRSLLKRPKEAGRIVAVKQENHSYARDGAAKKNANAILIPSGFRKRRKIEIYFHRLLSQHYRTGSQGANKPHSKCGNRRRGRMQPVSHHQPAA
jgi:RNase P/RNase MRP subunit p30